MAALNELDIEAGTIGEYEKRIFAAALWMWYYKNKDMKVAVHIWFIRTSVTLEQLYPLFVLLLGEDTALNHG
jgi:hypothetical protein